MADDMGATGGNSPNELALTTATAAPPNNDGVINAWLRQIYLEYDYRYFDHAISVSIQDFFNILATSSTDHDNSWLSDDPIALSLVLLTELTGERSDILVIPPSPAQTLSSVGLGFKSGEEFLGEWRAIGEAMKLDSIRWIVVPCNDGMTQQAEQELREKETKKASESANEEESRPGKENAKKSAPESTNESKKNNSSEAADKRVVGYTDPGVGFHWGFMLIDKQKETARWLDGDLEIERERNKTYIKHMWKAGWVAGKVLCGYDKVMEHDRGRFATSTLKHVPHDHDHNRYRGDGGAACGPWVFAMLQYILKHPEFLTDDNGLKGAFDKKQKWRHIKDMAFHSLQTRAAMQDIIRQAAEPNLPAEVLPFMLTVPILKILSRPSTNDLLRGINAFKGPKSKSPGRGGRGPDYRGDDDDDDYSTDPATWDPEKCQRAIQKFKDIADPSQLPEHLQVFLAEQYSLDPKKNDIPNKAGALLNVFEALQNHLVNFVQLPAEIVKDFVKLNPLGDALNPEMDEWEQRAILTRIFGDFDQLSKDDSDTVKDQDRRFGNFRDASHDEVIEKLKRFVATLPPTDRRGRVAYYPDSYIDYFTTQLGGGKAYLGKDGRITKEKPVETQELPDRSGWPEGVDELPNFARIPHEELTRWEASNTELFEEKKKGHNHVTSRALLHRKFKGSFESTSSADRLDVWVGDETVFDDFDNGGIDSGEILRKLIEIYEPHKAHWTKVDDAAKIKGKNPKAGNVSGAGNSKKRPNDGGQADLALKKSKVDYATVSTEELLKKVNDETPPKPTAPGDNPGGGNCKPPRKPEDDADADDEPKNLPKDGGKSSTTTAAKEKFKDVSKASQVGEGDQSKKPVVTDPPVIPTKTLADSGTKRKHDEGGQKDEADTTQPPVKRPKRSTPLFHHIPEKEIDIWWSTVALQIRNELRDSKLKIKNYRLARVWLERMFTDTFQTMEAKETLSEEDMKTLRGWLFMYDHGGVYPRTPYGSRKFLNEVLLKDTITESKGKSASIKRKVPFPDYSKDEGRWPDYWKKQKE